MSAVVQLKVSLEGQSPALYTARWYRAAERGGEIKNGERKAQREVSEGGEKPRRGRIKWKRK